MLPILYALLVLSFIAVVITLIMGGKNMTSTKEAARTKSNTWMWRRIYAQGAAVALLFLIYMVRRNGG